MGGADSDILLPVWAAADGVGSQSAILAPWLIGVYVADLHFSISQSGGLLTLEFGVVGAVSMAIATLMSRIDRRRIAVIGVLLVIAGNVGSAWAERWGALAITRSLCGVGGALAMSAGNATAAAATDAAQLYGRKLALLAVFGFAMFVVIPPLVDSYGPTSLFLGMAAFNVLMVLPIRRMPRFKGVTRGGESKGGVALAGGIGLWAGALIVAATFCFFTRDTMAYVLFERLARGVGVARQPLGGLIALSGLLGVLGPLAAVWLAHRLGPLIPALAAVVVGGMINYVLVESGSAVAFSAMVVVQPILNLGTYALHMSLASILDRHGRFTAACGGAFLAAYALAPALVSWIVDTGGYRRLSWVIFWATLLNLAALVSVASYLRSARELTRLPATAADPTV